MFDLVQLFAVYKMGTQKIVNLLNEFDNEFSNFPTKNGMSSLMIKIRQNMVKEIKVIQALNLKQKLLN